MSVSGTGYEPLRDSSGQAYIEFYIHFNDSNTWGPDSIKWNLFETNVAGPGPSGPIGDAEIGVDFDGPTSGEFFVSATVVSHTFTVRVYIHEDDLLEYPEYFGARLSDPTPTTTDYDDEPLLVDIQDSTPAVDIDNDSNSDGTIDASDDYSENSSPGARILVNYDDDNGNSTSDGDDPGPVTGENDLEEVKLWYASSGYHDVPDFSGWKLVLTKTSGGNVWTSADKASEIVFASTPVGTAKVWTIGTDSVPSSLYFEKLTAGSTGLTWQLMKPDWNGMGADTVMFTPKPSLALAELRFDGLQLMPDPITSSPTIPHPSGPYVQYGHWVDHDGDG